MTTNIAKLIIKDSEKLEFLIEQLKELQSQTRKEEGCKSFTFYQKKEQLNTFFLCEQFEDQAALDAHLELAHTQAFFSHDLVSVSQITPLIELV